MANGSGNGSLIVSGYADIGGFGNVESDCGSRARHGCGLSTVVSGGVAPWIAHRTAQGHDLVFVPCTLSAEEIRSAIREQAQASPVKFVVLIGDAEPAGAWEPSVRARCVPAFMAEAKVNIRWKSPPELATDNWYGDLDDDGVPELAVGRLPADSPADLAVMVAKILAYESVPVSGTWCQRINFVAGVGNLGALVDPIVEMAARKFLTDGIPAAYETTMTYANWRSPFCPNPAQFQDAALARFNEGCLFWVYIGHGYPYQLDRMRVPGSSFPVFGTGDVRRLDNRFGMPIAIFLACYTGAYDQPYDCLAEQVVRGRVDRLPPWPVPESPCHMPWRSWDPDSWMAIFSSGLPPWVKLCYTPSGRWWTSRRPGPIANCSTYWRKRLAPIRSFWC